MDPALQELLRAAEEADPDREVEAIIRLARPDSDVPDVRIVARFGSIATCRLRADDVVAVRARDDVVSLKAARRLSPSLEPATPRGGASSRIRASDVRRDPLLTPTGRGIVVAAVDWGIDFTAAAFRHASGPAAWGTRFLSIFDQRDSALGDRPAPYGYGAVHDRADIDRALGDPRPYERLGYHPAIADRGGGTHGTHVLDIAAGNGSGGGPLGLAPEADLIFVHLADRDTGGLANLGDSVRLLEAVDFIARTARSQPWVINLSVGRHGGPHDGTALIELAFDTLLDEAPGRMIVQSAGNYFRSRVHASGTLRPGETHSFTFASDSADVTPNELEIWYDGADEFAVRLDPPGGVRSRPVGLGEQSDVVADGRVVGRVYHRERDPNNGDNHIDAFLYPIGSAGTWTVTLEARRSIVGRFDAWLERDDACPGCQARFTGRDSNGRTTTGTIANSHLPLIVGAYDNHDPSRPSAAFSSAGPTRDGRRKPDLAAPGVNVIAARSAPIGASRNLGLLVRKSGTSMATPHVTGSVALCLELAGRRLSAQEVRRLALSSCERPPSHDPEHRLGHGYLNTPRLVSAVRRALTSSDAGSRTKEWIVNSTDIALLAAAPATALREFAYRPDSPTARWIAERYDVIGRPGQRILEAARPGDLLLQVDLGRPGGGRCVVLNEPELRHVLAGPWMRRDQMVLRPLAQAEPSNVVDTQPDSVSGQDAEDAELDRLVDQGMSENQITNALFYARHPGRVGVVLRPSSREAKEWRTIRDREVRPGLRQRLVVDQVDPVQMAVFLSQYENHPWVPPEYTKAFLTRTPLLSMGRTLRDRVLGHWRSRGHPLTASAFFALARQTAGHPGIAALLCHNVAKAFAKGGVAITWRETGIEGEYTDGQKTYTATVIHPAGRLKYYHGGKGREVLSIFYLLFSDREFGPQDPGDWYHFFVTATMTTVSSEGTLGATTGRGRREDIGDADDVDLGLEQALTLPTVTAFRFRNTGRTDPDNCCANCPAGLGVGEGGRAWCRMELRFTISGHRPGIDYEITRTRRDSLWQRVSGTWQRIGSSPMGTKDDTKGDYDECLVLRSGHIFVKDSPGFPGLVLPAPGQALNAEDFYGPGAVTSAAADDVVLRASFAEWVIARSRGEGVPWTPLELPPLPDGSRRRFVFWRCVVWIHRNGAGNFVLDPRSRIERGSFSAAVLNAEPV
jgi:subtilisin family serine protease